MADTKRTINCPACNKPMTKVFMKEAGISVDVCLDGCGGILFNNRELEKFDEEHENANEIFEAIKGKTFEPVNEQEVRICSVCDSPMVKQGSGVEGVEIDVCNICGAKFLDNGELEKIRTLRDSNSNKDKTHSSVDAAIAENPVNVGGSVGLFAKTHVPTLGARDAAENFVRKFLENW